MAGRRHSGGERKKKGACINRVVPDDLLVEILHRIPCKSAVQCKSVCKRWRNLISTKNFMSCFIDRRCFGYRNKVRELGEDGFAVKCIYDHLFVIPPEYKHQFSFDFLPFFTSIQEKPTPFIAGSCSGLFLCTADLKIQDQPVYYVCNPITKHWIALPPTPPLYDYESGHIYVGLAVFGFSPFKTNFKVVRVVSEFKVDVFCSNTGKWARLTAAGASPKAFSRYHNTLNHSWSPAIHYRGLMYWHGTSENQILVYDLNNNTFPFIIDSPREFIKFPPDVVIKFSHLVPAISAGKIYGCQLHNSTLRIWQLNQIHNQQPEWTFKGQTVLHCDGHCWLRNVFIKEVLTIHRHDPNIIYLKADSARAYMGDRTQYLVTFNLRTNALNLVYESENDLVHRADATYTMGFHMWPPPIL